MSIASRLFSDLEKSFEQSQTLFNITSGCNPIILDSIHCFKAPTSLTQKHPSMSAANLSNTIVFNQRIDRESIVSKDLIPKIDEILENLKENKTFSLEFLEICGEKMKNIQNYDFTAAILLISDSISKIFELKIPTSLISNKLLLDPRYILLDEKFRNSPFGDQINSLRTLSVGLLIHGNSDNVKTLLHSLIRTPELFSEYCHRLVQIQMQIDLSSESFDVLVRAFMYIMTYYQTLENLTEEQQKAVNSARMGLYLLLNNYMLQDDIMNRIFNEDIFIDAFFSQMYEPEVSPFVISHINRYLMRKESFENTPVLDKLMSIAKYVAENLEIARVVELGAELFGLISSAMVFSDVYISFFSPLIKDVMNGVVKTTKCDTADKFISSVILMMTITPDYVLTTPDVKALQKAIKNVYECEPTQQIFIRILQLVAGTPVANISPNFQIRQPKALRLLLTAFLDSELIENVVDFVAKLLQSSIDNCEAAHFGGFDICLIDILFSLRKCDMSKKVLVAKLYSLLMLIATHISSVSVVRKFVGLLNPIDGRYLPFYHQITVKLLSNMLQSTKKKPTSVIPLDGVSRFNLEGLKSDDINNGFTFSLWMFISSNDARYKSQIFLLESSDKNKIVLLLHGSTLIILLEKDGQQLSAQPDIKIPLNEWFNFNMTCISDIERDEMIVSSRINHQDSMSMYFPHPHFGSGKVSAKIGGKCPNSIIPERLSLIGPFGMFPELTKDQIISIVEPGPQGSIPAEIKPIMYMVPQEMDGNVKLVETSKAKRVSSSMSIKYSHTLSFGEVLVNKCGIDILLPLFAQWDLTFTNNEVVPYLPQTTIDVLENCFDMCEEAQTMFADSKGFSIISHLVRSSDEKNITYALYLRFFALFSVLTSEVAQKSLVQDILMNNEIWIKSDANDHLRIVKHWLRALLPSKRFIKLCDFGFLLSILRIYYWYEGDVSYVNMKYPNRCRGQKLNVNECRKCILAIAHMVARVKFTPNDFKLLISHILTVGSIHQNIDLLYLLRELIDDESVPLLKSESPVELIALLQYLLNLQDEIIVSSLIATVVEAHRKSLFKSMTIVDHLDIILHQLAPSFISKSLLIMLVEFAGTNTPELFPICSWMAANIGNKALKYMLSHLKAGKQYNLSHNWSQWLVVAMYKADPEMKKIIVRFLIESSGSNLGQLITIADVVGKALGDDVDTVKHFIIQEVGKQVAKGNEAVSVDEYIRILKHFVFFREGENGSLALQSMYQNSPFSDVKPSQRSRKPHGTPPRNLCTSPKKKKARKARHSLHPSAILQFTEKTENYSPLLAEQALAVLNPVSSIIPTNASFKSRRVSMLTMGPRKYDYETHRDPDKKVVSMMPGEMDKKIAEVAEQDFIYTFGLRFSKSGQWLDLDLAEQFMDICVKLQLQNHSQIALSLAAYLLHFGSQKATEAISYFSKSESSLKSCMALVAHHAQQSEMEIPIKLEKSSFEKSSFELSQNLPNILADKEMNIAPLRLLKKTLRLQTVNSTRAYKIFGMISDHIVAMSSNSVNEVNDIISQNCENSEKQWHLFWQCNTAEHAPWVNSLPTNVRTEAHYKRDNTLCPFLVPIKMKRNYKYDDHKNASLLRDTGNVVTAEIALEKYRKSLQEEYEKNAPAQLFEVKDENMDNLDIDEPEEKKYSGNDCIIELPCEVIKNKSIKKATFALLADSVVITYENGRVKSVNLKVITGLFLRTRFHHPTAIEIFVSNGQTLFINFPNILAIPILKHFKRLDMPALNWYQSCNFLQFANDHKRTQKWINREMSNFEYLMHLNLLSGRSFNDVSQYPVIPWILADYSSKILDFNDPNTFRDLSKPIGALSKERLDDIKDKQESLIFSGLQPYLYSSGYSCPLSVYLWLMRMEPFSTLHIDMQSGKFDHASRLFSSVGSTWEIATTQQNDFRELTPEFFSQPEFLVNSNGYDLGNYEGHRVNDVELPPWAETPFDFVYQNRKALESEYVSKNLNNWIDLVWGYKQDGKEAEKADNVFIPQMYPTIWENSDMQNPQTRATTEAILCHVGQIPQKLFNEPHPERMSEHHSASSLARPVSVTLCSNNVINTSVSMNKAAKFKISVIDENGLLGIFVFDANNLNKLSKNAISKPRSRSDSNKTIADESRNWKAMRKSTVGTEAVEISVGDFNSSAKVIKQFEAVKPGSSLVSVTAFDSSIFFVGKLSSELYRIIPSGHSLSLVNRQRSSINALATNGSWLMTANDDAVISFYSINDASKPRFTIPSFTSSITSCSISSVHQQAVCGTKDSSLIIISLSDSCIVKTVDMNGRRPLKILITNGWGFILVYSTDITTGTLKHFLTVYNINGEQIREVEIPSAVSSWSACTDQKGFDYIVMGDENGFIYHFEAFYANIGDKIFSVENEVATVKYLTNDSIISAITCDGRAFFIPYSL